MANPGRRPYRSLSADVTGILHDRLGLLLRGEIIWRKVRGGDGPAPGAAFRSPTNPVMRDLTERVIVASKGRFEPSPHPHQATSGGAALGDDPGHR